MNPLFLAQAPPPPPPSPTPEPLTISEGLEITNHLLIWLGSAAVLYVFLIFAGRILKRRFNVPLGWLYHVFAVAVALFIPAQLPWVVFPSAEKAVSALLISACAMVLVIIIRRYFFGFLFQQRGNTSVPKFLSEIVTICIVILALFIVLDGVYGIEVPGLLAGAGIVGIVLGLALQDTLGNVFSGFAIYFGGQFKSGDWLLVGEQHAQIVETNWRSTRLRTIDDIYLDIPNSNITKETVVNYNYPDNLHALVLDIGLEYDASPAKVRKVLVEAALNCPHVLRSPAPDVYLKEFANCSVTYQLRFWLDDHSKYRDAYSEIRTHLWYSLRRNKISIPYPIQAEYPYEFPSAARDEYKVVREALTRVAFYECLAHEQIERLVRGAGLVLFGTGERIICQGTDAGSMYILISGRAEVLVENNGTTTSLATIGPGDCIGEISLLTGESRSATVRALEDCEAVELGKETILPLLSDSPELLSRLSDILARRRLQNEGILAETANASQVAEKQKDYSAGFLRKLKSFFEL